MHSFRDFAKEEFRSLEGEKLKIGDVLNHEIEALAFKIFPSKSVKGKDCLQIQFNLDGKLCITFTNSVVLIRQIREYESELPFRTTIKHIASYYTFT